MSKSPSLRRIQADIRELRIDPSDQYHAAPLESDMFEWHFTIRGPADTEFEGGIYHGKILLPPEYPFKPPDIVFLTPSGRFETNTKVCLSFSAHHPELWQPAWGVRLILEALISFLPTPADGAIGALDWTKEERKKLAKESVKFRCPVCCGEGGTCADLLPEMKTAESKDGDGEEDGKGKMGKTKTRFREEIERLKMLQFQSYAVECEEKEKGQDTDRNMASNNSKKESVDEQQPQNQLTSEESLDEQKPAAVPTSKSSDPAAKSSAENETISKTTSANHDEKSTPSINSQGGSNISLRAEENAGGVATSAPAASRNEDTVPLQPDLQDEQPLMVPAEEGSINVLVSDSFLNGMIAALAIVVAVLLRKAQSLVDELRHLEDS
mmetsp:Transcript_9324/g.18462  ORF Transcript_9324/g.18462 Transcript_9324/m.18462 type:complete len:382 (+) Transcript_9324:81-1226(+)